MKRLTVKTIDITARQWFDKVNGNSYFSARVTINFGMKSVQNLVVPFQYGYGDHYIYTALKILSEKKIIKIDEYTPFWKFSQDNKIILRTSKQINCLKRDVINFGME